MSDDIKFSDEQPSWIPNDTVTETKQQTGGEHRQIIGIGELSDEFGFKGQFSPMRDLKVAQPYRVVGTTFGASIDTNFWTAATNGAGAASGVSSGLATVSSGTANSGYGILSSAHAARFQFAHPLMFRGGYRVSAVAVAGSTRRWGAFSVSTVTPQDGVYFEVDAAGALSVNHVGGATATKVASGSFNGPTSATYTMDTNIHAYEIVYFTLGAWFYIDNVLIHTFAPTTSILYETLNVPINITAVNSASGVTSATVESFNTSILKLGRSLTATTSKYQDGTTAGLVCKTGAGLVHNVVISEVTQNSVIILYDNTAASGTILWSTGAMSAQTQPFSVSFGLGAPFFTGLTLVISGADSKITLGYE